MAAYVIIEIKVRDRDAYREYVEKVRPVVEKHDGRYLCRGGAVTPFSGNWNPERIILIEFPSVEAVFRCFKSEEYGEIAHLRERSTEGRAIIVEGEADGDCGLRSDGFEL
jgi:uncharacterized protein (DUF1330 family)